MFPAVPTNTSRLSTLALIALWLVALAVGQQAASPLLNTLDVGDARRESKLARLRLDQNTAVLSPLDTKCLTSKTDELCNDRMKTVKGSLVSILQNGCVACSTAERAAAGAAASALLLGHPHLWKLLVLRHALRNARPKHCTRHQRLLQNGTKAELKLHSSVAGNATGARAEWRAASASNGSALAPCNMCRERNKSKNIKKFQPPTRRLKKRFHNAKKDLAFWVY